MVKAYSTDLFFLKIRNHRRESLYQIYGNIKNNFSGFLIISGQISSPFSNVLGFTYFFRFEKFFFGSGGEKRAGKGKEGRAWGPSG